MTLSDEHYKDEFDLDDLTNPVLTYSADLWKNENHDRDFSGVIYEIID